MYFTAIYTTITVSFGFQLFDPCAERLVRNLRKEAIFWRTNVVNFASFSVTTPFGWRLPGLCFRRPVRSNTDYLNIYVLAVQPERKQLQHMSMIPSPCKKKC